ncbi:MAG TPA: amino acid adenylation domain-containing protein [Azospirillaceae bacterium]|nr:amino acid adenylation domain-containing protein [Azospirillaceae bacterium]
MPHLLHEWFSETAVRRSEATAIVWNDTRMTYGEVERASNRLARALREAGCRDGERVALLLPKSPDAVVAMLAALKARCLYVPVDIHNPPARVARIIQACRPRVILATAAVCPLLAAVRAECPEARVAKHGCLGGDDPAFDFGQSDVDTLPCRTLALTGSPEERAHILFTSGSTGQPKGVVIRHSSIARFVEWAVGYFGMGPGDRVSGHSPLHFDLSTFDIYGAFAAGAELHMVPPELNLLPHKMAGFIRDRRLTQWFSVPSAMNFMARTDVVKPGGFPDLRRVLWCGEVLPTPTLIHWMKHLPHARFTNLYGPTETTIASSYYTVPECPRDPRAAIPIGMGCGGERLLVLGSQLRPVPFGETGDLYIAGVGLAAGYWEDPEKTRAAFVPDISDGEGDGRMYRTGDLARVGPDGQVLFVGRADTQIKSRGYRIELGEIEAALGTLDGLKDYAVVAVGTEAFEGATICCAFAAKDGAAMTPTDLRRRLADLVPGYMVPTRWATLPDLPKNANGKIDRRRLHDEVFGPG